MHTHYAEVLATFSVSQFQQFKRAYRTLLAAGIDREMAMQILIDAHIKRQNMLRERRDEMILARVR